MKRSKLIGVMLMAIALIMAITAPLKADTDTYQYVGVIENGHTYGGTGVAKFQMADGYTAFCVDVNTVIKTKQDYIKLSLEDAETLGVLTHPERVRAILNYSWDKTGKDEITGIQYALWHYMNDHTLPASANSNVKSIYNRLIDPAVTPSIPASEETLENVLTVTHPTGPLTSPTFQFTVETTLNTDILVTITKDGTALDPANYTLDEESGLYTFTWLEEFVSDVEFKVTVTTLKNKAVNAWAFFSIDKTGKIDKKLSQTVAGLKPTESLQSKDFPILTYVEPPTTTPPTTTEPTTTEPETTPTEPETEPTTVEETTHTEPQTTPTEPATTTVPETTERQYEEFPVTGEVHVGKLMYIAFGSLAVVFILLVVINKKWRI